MNVYENMAFGLSLHGMPKDKIGAKVKEAAEILDIRACSNASRKNYPADSGSAWPWAGRLCGSRKCF